MSFPWPCQVPWHRSPKILCFFHSSCCYWFCFGWFGLVVLFGYSANFSYSWRQKFGWALLSFASHLAKASQILAEWLKRWLISIITPKERMLFSRGQHSKPQPPKASRIFSAGSLIFVWPGAAWTAAMESGICCPKQRRHNRTWDPNSTI